MMNPEFRVFLGVETHTAYGREILRGIGHFQRSQQGWDCILRPWVPGIRYVKLEELDGAIIRVHKKDDLRPFQENGIPFINVSASSPQLLDVPTVTANQREIGRRAAEHFLSKGFLSFGYTCLKGRWFGAERYAGFSERIQQAGRSTAPPFFFSGALRDHADDVRAYLQALPSPRAIFCGNDLIGRDLLELLRHLDLSVPDDIAVLGVDNDSLICELPRLQLSSISPSAYHIGLATAEWLDEMMRGHPRPAERPLHRFVQPGDVIERHSTNVFAVKDAALRKALRYIREHLGESIQIDGVAQHAGICRKSLELRFQEYLRHTPGEEIRRRRVDKACHLLTQGDLPMSEIAEQCGLHNQSALSTLIKKYRGLTPSQVRNASGRVGALLP